MWIPKALKAQNLWELFSWVVDGRGLMLSIWLTLQFYSASISPFIYFKSNILSMRISFKIIATLSCLPQITILAHLLLTRHWQLNTVCFPGLSWLSHPAGGMLRQRGPQHCNSNWPWLYKLINQTVVSLHLKVQWGLYFLREKSKRMACFLFSFYNRKFCSVNNIYIQSCERWLRNHCDHLHNELSWNFDGLLTHQSVQLSFESKAWVIKTDGQG